MTALIVTAVIILLFAALFSFSIRAELKFLGGTLDFKVKYMFFTFYPKKGKKAKAEKDSKSTAFMAYGEEIPDDEIIPEAEAAAEKISVNDEELLEGHKIGRKKKDKGKKEKVSAAVRIEQGKILWESLKKPLSRLFRGIYISNLVIDFTAGGRDAYEAGMNYGKMNAIVYNAISAVRMFFTVTVKTVDINVDFNLEKSVYDAECSVRLKLGTALAVLLTAGFGVLRNWSRLFPAGKDAGEKGRKKKVSAEKSALS